MTSTEEALEAVFARWARRTHAPAITWGLVRAGELICGGGLGTVRVETSGPAPTVDTVVRIASMTKSFTAAALMTLVVKGTLRLDDPVALHVPELRDWRGATADAPPLTVRHLASMESGLPTDDPWADRHLDLSDDQMDALIARGAGFAWTPGVRFEYSNLGWGLLGRVIERAAGARVQEIVSSALLQPLGMTATTWERPMSGEIAEPFGLRDGRTTPETEPLGDGAIAPMGGLWSSVRDLARWVGFFTDAFPPRDDHDDAPLPRWARREMQQLRRVDAVAPVRPSPAGPSRVAVTGYGLGLGIRIDERVGVSVGHSGGLPGYGSHMRWLPDRGVGIVALSNVTYGNMHGACVEAIEVLADLDDLGPPHPIRASASFSRAVVDATALLSSWNDDRAGALFADNVHLDEPIERRGEIARGIVARHGALDDLDLDLATPMRGALARPDGAVRVEIGLNHDGRVQWLDTEDRSLPSRDPIAVDGRLLEENSGIVYVVVRPVGRLADAFDRWQGEALDRLDRSPAAAPAAHATMKALGQRGSPISPDEAARIVSLVEAWAETQPPIDLRAERLDVFDEDGVIPVVRLATTDTFRSATVSLWDRAEREGLPPGYSDEIGPGGWIPHLSLVYAWGSRGPDRARILAWAESVQVDSVSCVAAQVELVAYDERGERRLGVFDLNGR